jgi:hypothetical protein
MIDHKADFRKPNNFDDRLSEVKRRIAALAMKAGNTGGQNEGYTHDNYAHNMDV